jgi:aminocarboxymuconate-semialdehyde decarboxylase
MNTPAQPVLDVHAHAMPMPLLRWLSERGLADLGGVGEEIVRLDTRVSGVGHNAPLPLAPSQHDPAVRLAEMDAVGVSHHAVSLPPFLFASTADDGGFVAEVVRRGNDELARYVAAAPDRLVALGSVPIGWPGAADEARRCLEELDMAGIAIGSRGGGRDLDDPVNENLWSLLGDGQVFVFMHPSGVPDGHRLRDFYLAQLVGYPMETALAVARLVFGGVLERHPITLCLAHGGGCLPSVRGRLDLGWDRKSVARTTAEPPSRLTGRLYYDTAVFSPVLLRRLVEDVGTGHVLLGTDHPFELGDRDPVGTVRAAGLGEAATRAILWDNGAALLKRRSTAATPAAGRGRSHPPGAARP